MHNKPHLDQFLKKEKEHKYKAQRTTIDGITFDSKAEANRYWELKMLQRAGKIQKLELQPEFELVPGLRWNGKKLRTIKYRADFRYIEDGIEIVEDVKGMLTKEYKIKRLLFLNQYPQYKFIETK